MALEVTLDADTRALDKKFQRLEDRYDKLSAKQKEWSDAVAATPGPGSKATGSSAAASAGGSTGGRLESARRESESLRSRSNPYGGSPMGPRERLDTERLRMHLAQREGVDDLTDYRGRIERARIAVDRQNRLLNPLEKMEPGPKSFADRAIDSVMTSRMNFGAGGFGLMPLVNRLASLVGPGALAVGGLGAGVAAMAENASAQFRAIGNARNVSGGSPYEVAGLAAVGGFLGINAAQKAEQFGNTLHGGGFGASYFMSRGIVDQGIYTTDKAGNYLNAIRELANIKDDRTAQMVARSTGMQDELWFRRLSPGSREGLLNNMKASASDRELSSEAEYSAARTNASLAADRLIRAVGKPAMTIAGDVLDPVGTYDSARKEGLVDIINRSHLSPKDKAEQIEAIRNGKTVKEMRAEDRQKGLRPGSRETTPGAMPNAPRVTPGVVGGGPHREASVPVAWRYWEGNSAMDAQANRLGAF